MITCKNRSVAGRAVREGGKGTAFTQGLVWLVMLGSAMQSNVMVCILQCSAMQCTSVEARSLALVYPPVSRITLSSPPKVEVARKDRRRAVETDILMVEVSMVKVAMVEVAMMEVAMVEVAMMEVATVVEVARRMRSRATDYGILISAAFIVYHVQTQITQSMR